MALGICIWVCANTLAVAAADIEGKILRGVYTVVYLTPEYAKSSPAWVTRLNSTDGITVIAIDEAHCVCQWGKYSFLPLPTRIACGGGGVRVFSLDMTDAHCVWWRGTRILSCHDRCALRVVVVGYAYSFNLDEGIHGFVFLWFFLLFGCSFLLTDGSATRLFSGSVVHGVYCVPFNKDDSFLASPCLTLPCQP